MRRSLTFVVGTAAGAVLIAAAGVSAHTGGANLLRMVGIVQSHLGDEASGTRLETPEPSDSPEASPRAEPNETPETADSAAESSSSSADGEEGGDSQGGSGGGNGSGHDREGGGGGD